MINPLYISYATANTPYTYIIAQGLIPSLKKLNLEYEISYPESRGNWFLNTQLKANVIYDMMNKHKRPLVMLDADAYVQRYPDVFNTLGEYDLAFHLLDTQLFWKNVGGHHKREPLTGTMFINYNPAMLEFIAAWIRNNTNNPKLHDMANFESTLRQFPNIKIFQLPIEYVTIVDRNNKLPKCIANPVIVHYQASRKYRRTVK